MTAVLVMVGLVVLSYLVLCTIRGMQPAETEIAWFVSETAPLKRTFSDPVAVVRSAYVQSVPAVAGMSVIDEDNESILIDMKPTVRVMDGSFGMLILISFQQANGGTVVTVHAQRKVPFVFAVRLDAACMQAERSLRMKAKRSGIDEVVARL